ncbi:S-layer homology domain-containing protein [Cohnella sp. GCM10027633]|uniref:S-layer homology domain-containing protein n=1 Tax=unclassified Cohnella TaxID=2636738 RepID=UPI00362AF3EE
MRKSVLYLWIALLAFGTSLSQLPYAHAAESDFTFTVGSNSATVTGYEGADLNVIIPDALGGMPVTSLARSAFDTATTGKPKITSVAIPNSVTTIQTYAFRYNSLSSIDLPDSLLTIGSSAFENNPLTSVVFPDSVTMIGNYSFYMNSLTSITLPDSLKTISGGAFDTNHIAKLVIPAGVTTVQSSAFYNNNLTSVTVLGAATTFGTDVFRSNPANLKIFGSANSTAATYAANNGHAFVDGTALFQAVATAKSSLQSHPPGAGIGNVPGDAFNDLTAALVAAKLDIDGIGNATVASDLTDAAAPLIAAISAFQARIIVAGDPGALGAALTEAKQALTDHPAGAGAGQASAGDRGALQTAINAAQPIFDQAGNYLQAELDAAVVQLEAAMDTFAAAIIPAGDPTALGHTIANAQQALTDHPLGTGVGQTSSGTRDGLQTAINTAQQIVQNAGLYSQSQLDTAVGNLTSAIQAFNAAVIGPGDPSALGAAIPAAQQALTDHPQGTGVGQASAGARGTLETAIDTAQQILNRAGNYTQTQLDAATSALTTATATFRQAVVPAGDSSTLATRLTNARQAMTNHPEGTNVGQASASDRNALQAAINAAQAIADDAANRTQGQLNAAVADLDAAMDTFDDAIVPAGDATDLEDLLADATQKLADHPEGTNVGQASASDRNALQAAINAAQAIADDAANQTQGQLDDAVGDLEAAMDTFDAAIVPAGDATDLEGLLTDAVQKLADHPQGAGVGQASVAARGALQTAINAAQAIADDAANQTQGQLDDAVADLDAAMEAFDNAIIPAGDATDLEDLLADATQKLADHPLGTNVGQASASDRNALQAAINAAQAIADDAANRTQGQLGDAVADLEDALDTFDDAIIPAGDPTDLEDLLADAIQMLADHPEGAGVGQASANDRNVLQAAINAAQAIADDAANQTQGQLDDAVADLEAAMEAFESAWVGLVLTAPANALYGPNHILRFKVVYGYDVIVTGTPVVPLEIGTGSDVRTAYAAYTGVRNAALTELIFEYEVPAGIADADGIEVTAALALPNGASIARASGGAASPAYVSPDTSGVYIVAIPPDITLTATPDGSTRQAVEAAITVYGATAGNALTALRWLPGSLGTADFAGGTSGTDMAAQPRFTVSANGDYTVYARDAAGNEAAKTIAVTGIYIPSSVGGDRPVASDTTVTMNPAGGITALVDPSEIERVTLPDGTKIKRVILSERARNRVLELLQEATNPLVTIAVNDREHVVYTRFSADWMMQIADANPDAIIEAKLNGSSYRLPISALDLAGLAKRLDSEVSDLTVSIVQEQAGENIRQEIDRIGLSQGFAVFGGVIDYRVTAEANGRTAEVREFGGTYIVRTIKLDGEATNRNLVAVQYDPTAGTVVFVPARLQAGSDGSTEAILSVPHNSLYTVVDAKTRTFADLTGHWAKADVELLASKLLVNGQTADRFAPEGTITRAEFLAMLVRGLGLSAKKGEGGSRYTDVPASTWYAPTIDAAVANGLATGIGADRFAPNDPITREQMALVIGSALTFAGHGTGGDGQAGGPLAAFADRDAIASWAQAAVARASASGIMKGMEDGRFAPKGYATRAQAAVMLKRLLQYMSMID